MRILSISLTVIFGTCVFAGCIEDDGLVTWAKDYPKPGQIVVKVDAKPAKGYAVVSGEILVWPKCGGEVKKTKIKLSKDGTLPVTIVSGLEPGQSYNIVVDVTEKQGEKQHVRRTDPVVISAPQTNIGQS